MADYPNGGIPPEALTALSVGGSLLSGAAASFERWRAQATAAGRELTITSVADAYRSFEQQEDVFFRRYKVVAGNGPYNDVRMYNGKRYVRVDGAAAAVPGTSNHGRGIAVDIKNVGPFGGSFHNWLSATGPALGWTNTEGRSVNEPWHWVHGGNTTTPPTEDDMPLTNDEIDRIAQRVWSFQNPALEKADAYALLRASRDGTITANEVHRLLRTDIPAAITRSELLIRQDIAKI